LKQNITMADKFGRRFKLTVEIDTPTDGKNALEITSPLTIELDIVRNTLSSLNTGTFRVYNLSETNRSLIFQNRYNISSITNRKAVILQAGYGTVENKDSDLSTIFMGGILEAYSYRQGTDIVTYINAQDGAIGAYNSNINKTFAAGTSQKDIVSFMIDSLPDIAKGSIGAITGTPKTSYTVNGNIFSNLTKSYKDEFFIDNNVANILKQDEYIKTDEGILLINSESGLLGTPLRQGFALSVDMLFEPKIKVGHIVEINSQINKKFNGQFKVMGLKHSGVISDAVNGDCSTNLQLNVGTIQSGGLSGV